jgi:hypothetical protein
MPCCFLETAGNEITNGDDASEFTQVQNRILRKEFRSLNNSTSSNNVMMNLCHWLIKVLNLLMIRVYRISIAKLEKLSIVYITNARYGRREQKKSGAGKKKS